MSANIPPPLPTQIKWSVLNYNVVITSVLSSFSYICEGGVPDYMESLLLCILIIYSDKILKLT